MKQDEIIEMARQVGFYGHSQNFFDCTRNQIEAFSRLVAAKVEEILTEQHMADIYQAIEIEREACAKLCYENAQKALSAQKVIDGDDLSDVFLRHHASAHLQTAQAIRARGEA